MEIFLYLYVVIPHGSLTDSINVVRIVKAIVSEIMAHTTDGDWEEVKLV